MGKALIQVLGFFTKELNEVRRQPRLVLALILGPFLILLLFGLGYQTVPPRPRALLVIPDTLKEQIDTDALTLATNLTYDLEGVTNDENAALARLRAREVDLVQVLPADAMARLERGESVPVMFHYAEINPLNEGVYQSLGYAQVNELNKALLVQTTQQVQEDAQANEEWIGLVRGELDTLAAGATNLPERRENLRRLRTLVGLMVSSPLLAAQATVNGQTPEQVQADLNTLATDLDALDAAIANETLAQEETRIQEVRTRVAAFETLFKRFSRMPAQVIVSPLHPAYSNEQGQALSLATFYAPGVLALILQHIAVTLGALSLVRERLLGAVELFRVAPLSARRVLLGKYLAYAVFLGILGTLLAVAMTWMQVPFRGSGGAFAGILALLVIASLGIGFLISTISKSDTQAVQLSMLMLLFSIFFSGFFLPLDSFWLPVRTLGYAMPITPGILALQDVMLRGAPPALWLWLLLGGSALVTFLLVNLFAARQLRFA
jgi:ABC-2 type transport system permease protein